MANPTTKRGFTKINTRSGSSGAMGTHLYYINDGYATAVYEGDAVVRVAAGSNDTALDSAAGAFPVGSLPEVQLAAGTDGSAVTGVVVGFIIVATAGGTDLSLHPGRASVHRIAVVDDDPQSVFKIRDDGASAIGITAVGLNALFEVGTPSSVTRRSGMVLDTNGTAPSADASNPLRIVGVARDGVVKSSQNDPTLVNTEWLVQFNNHTELSGALGI